MSEPEKPAAATPGDNGALLQEVTGGEGGMAQRPLRLHFGLGDATKIDSVTVRWPSGKIESFKAATGRLNKFTEGKGRRKKR